MVPLTLAEQILLLALDDESGKLRTLPDRSLDFALAGAIVADLTRADRVKVENDQLTILDSTPVDSKPEDFGLLDLQQSNAKSLANALTHLAAEANGLRKRLIEQLVDKGVLKRENREVLWVFHYSRYPLADPSSENAVRQRLRKCIRNENQSLTEVEHVMISLVHVCQMEDLLLTEAEREQYRARIRQICEHDRIGRAVMASLKEIQKAILEIRTYSGM